VRGGENFGAAAERAEQILVDRDAAANPMLSRRFWKSFIFFTPASR